jgi:hypothetical protein
MNIGWHGSEVFVAKGSFADTHSDCSWPDAPEQESPESNNRAESSLAGSPVLRFAIVVNAGVVVRSSAGAHA